TALRDRANRFADELEHWRAACAPIADLPADHPVTEAPTVAAARELRAALDVAQTRALSAVASGQALESLILTALLQTLSRWSGQARQVIDLEGHGRAGHDAALDLSRTMGWFTANYPLSVALPPAAPAAQYRHVTDALAAVPGQGIGFGVLRQHAHRELAASPAQVMFNFLGRVDVPQHDVDWRLAPEPVRAQRATGAARDHALDLIAALIDAGNGPQLSLTLRYDSARWERTTMDLLLRRLRDNLSTLAVTLAVTPAAAGSDATPVSKPATPGAAAVSDPKHAALLARLGKRRR
ncbi:MAG: condensation domain-containing protein, partial [Pseudomonadota bacterium]